MQTNKASAKKYSTKNLIKGSDKCKKLRRTLACFVDLTATGSRVTNALVAWTKCEVKAARMEGRLSSPLESAFKEQQVCQAGIMGSGTFRGRNNCATELSALLECLNETMKKEDSEVAKM